MRCDNVGNLYIARYGAGVVVILNPQGETIRTIKLNGAKPTNVAFGGIKGDIVYVTINIVHCTLSIPLHLSNH